MNGSDSVKITIILPMTLFSYVVFLFRSRIQFRIHTCGMECNTGAVLMMMMGENVCVRHTRNVFLVAFVAITNRQGVLFAVLAVAKNSTHFQIIYGTF